MKQVRDECQNLEDLKKKEQEDQERIKHIAEERKMEIEKARILREGQEVEHRLEEQLQQIQLEKEKIANNRQKLEVRQKDEIERRDFMHMIRQTAENVN